MKEIQLDKGQVALVDDEDFEWLNQFKWHASWNKDTKTFYANRSKNLGNGKYKGFTMSRFIMNTPKDMNCDHINHNTLDNRKSNLRNCTRSQNSMNRKLRKDNKSNFTGVRKRFGKYQAQVNAGGRIVFIKTFPTLEEAVAARNEIARQYHGEFYCDEKPLT